MKPYIPLGYLNSLFCSILLNKTPSITIAIDIQIDSKVFLLIFFSFFFCSVGFFPSVSESFSLSISLDPIRFNADDDFEITLLSCFHQNFRNDKEIEVKFCNTLFDVNQIS